MGEVPTPASETKLRLIAINDVYLLDNFARLRTLIDTESVGFDNVVKTMAGDFLGPSLLSSLDQGASMVEMLNKCDIDTVCFGNHECDVPYPALVNRIGEYKGTWLNTNMPSFKPSLPEAKHVTVKAPEGSGLPDRKVAFIGLLIGGGKFAATYRDEAFDGAHASIVPILEAAPAAVEKLRAADPSLDCVVPLTHQDMAEDVELAKSGLFPVIVAGHDHDVTIETFGTCPVVKAGQDAQNAALIDLVWSADAPPGSPPTSVTVTLKSCADYEPNAEIEKVIHLRHAPVRELETATLAQLLPAEVITSKDTRYRPTSMAAKLATAIRMTLTCEGALINSGAVRGDRDYDDTITFADLKKECPFPSAVVVVKMPGAVLREAVKVSREKWLLPEGPEEASGALQCDEGMSVDIEKGHAVQSVMAQPLDDASLYAIACDTYDLKKNPVLKEYGLRYPERIPPEDAGRPPLPILVEYFCGEMWKKLTDADGDGVVSHEEVMDMFNNFDTNGDGEIDLEELTAAVQARLGPKLSSGVIIEQMLEMVDKDRSGKISQGELQHSMRQLSMRSPSPDAVAAQGAPCCEPRSLDGVIQAARAALHPSAPR